MYLQKLDLAGFKSFAKKTALEFPQPQGRKFGIAAIVGPNGSGKSCLAESIRWVLGEQSLKLLRGKKADDVIFSGSGKRAQMGLAEVTLTINNEDGKFPLDYPEVTITRRFHRNGEGEYLLNKKQVRLTDILLIMAKANFGQRSYSVIGQGMVDSILNTTPQERKEFFDEAVGVKQYQMKREISARKLERAWENVKQVEVILDEIRPRLNSLTRQVKRLERRKEVEGALLAAQKRYYGLVWQEYMSQEQNVRPTLEKLQQEVARAQAGVRDTQRELDLIEQQDSRAESFSRLQKKYQETLDAKNALREKEMILKNTIEIARQRSAMRTSPMPVHEIIRHLESFQADLFGVREIVGLQKILKKLSSLISELKNPRRRESESGEKDQKLTQELISISDDAQKKQRELESVAKEIAEFNQRADQQKGKFFELQKEFQAKQARYHESIQKYSDSKIDFARLETRREDLEREIRDELQTVDWLKSFKIEGQRNKEFLQSEIQRFKRQLELIGGIDPEIIEEYEKTKERYDFLYTQSEDLNQSLESLKKAIYDLDETIHKQFDQSFKNIKSDFEKFFKMLFAGGKAELELLKSNLQDVEEEQELQAAMEGLEKENLKEAKEEEEFKKLFQGKAGNVIGGIEILATPPGKKLKNIQMLSGGERALTSIALICAIISNNPSPFVVLDEVDAALDEANSERLAAILEELSHKTQFIVITHNRATMHKANILYGVTMGDDGVSKLLSLKLEEAEMAVK